MLQRLDGARGIDRLIEAGQALENGLFDGLGARIGATHPIRRLRRVWPNFSGFVSDAKGAVEGIVLIPIILLVLAWGYAQRPKELPILGVIAIAWVPAVSLGVVPLTSWWMPSAAIVVVGCSSTCAGWSASTRSSGCWAVLSGDDLIGVEAPGRQSL